MDRTYRTDMKHVWTTTLLLMAATAVMAIPARKEGRQVTLTDGSTVMVYGHGDESMHWTTTADGRWMQQTADGRWQEVEPLSEEQISQRRAQARRLPQQTTTASPLNIAPRGLVIMVNFKDTKFKMTREEMDSMINAVHYVRDYSYKEGVTSTTIHAEGSARQYFIDQSFGQYQPQFDVVGPYNLPKNAKYYGENGWYGSDENALEMVEKACEYARDSSQVDFSLYDNDHDGVVDFVYVFYAGYGEADGGGDNTIWPHSYSIEYDWYYSGTFNGKTLGKYACSNELNYQSKVHDGIGTFVHEFSHVLGLPDLYDTNSGTQKTCGAWDVMDYGPYNNDGNTPPAYSAYERFFMGWMTPTLLTDSATVTLATVNDSAALIVTSTGQHNMVGNNPNPTTFYMLENRQKEGWDKYIPGHGLLLTKVSYDYSDWQDNVVNNTKSAMGVDIVEADGQAPSYKSSNTSNGYFGKQGDCFPSGAIAYQTKAPFTTYTLTNIEEDNERGEITLDYMGGGDNIYIGHVRPEPEPEPSALEDIEGTTDSQAQKILNQGHIYIRRDGKVYDLQGQIVNL